jgi:biopolymer transport protein ExbB
MVRMLTRFSRSRLLLAAVVMVVGTTTLAGTSWFNDPVFAQEGDQDNGADQAAGDDAEDAGSTSDEKKEAQTKSFLEWLVDALGVGYIVIFLLLSFALVALFVMNLLAARRDGVCPPMLIEGFENHLDEKRYQEAYELSKADESFLGNVLSAGLAKLSSGYAQSIEAMQEVGEEENMKLDHRLSYMALIGTISPMIGLFGTVHGMIDSFWEIATGGGTPDADKLAEGISTALLTTLIGLGIAIPAIAAYNILRNRVQRLVLEVGITSEELMARFESLDKKKTVQ